MGRFLVFALVLGLVQLSLANQNRQRNLGRSLGRNVGRMETVDPYGSSSELLRDMPLETFEEPEPIVEAPRPKLPVTGYASHRELPLDDGYATKTKIPQRDLPLPVPEPIVRPLVPSRKSFGGYSSIQRDTTATTTTTTTTTTPTLGYGSMPARKTIQKDLPFRKTFQRDPVTTTTTTTPAPIRDLCRPNPCKNLGRCIPDQLRGFKCLCSQYFFGELCEREIPTTTVPTYGGDMGGYGGMGGEEGELSFEEDTVIEKNPCLNEGRLEGSKCLCPWGWTGQFCEICLTSCASNPCPSSKKCIAKYGGGFDCVCPEDRKGINCELQNDACTATTCLNGGLCKPALGGSFRCECDQPFAGDRCEKQWNNPCTEEVLRELDVMNFEFPWDLEKYIVCTDVDEWVAMNCSFGTKFNKKLGHCVPDLFELPELPSNYCDHGEAYLSGPDQIACLCRAGYTGEFCEINIDECAPFRGKNVECVDQVNTYYLRCSDYEIGLDCRESIEIPCTEENLSKNLHYFEIGSDSFHYVHCSGVDQFTVRKCAGGLFWNQEEETCTFDKPEIKTGVCTTFPCKNSGRCLDRGGSNFECVCKEGYTGRYCEKLVDLCELKNPCMNGGKCLSYPGGYTCVCPDKLIDDCCCNGVSNPCPMKPIPGVSSYFPHLFPHKYIHCDYEGRAFVRTCAPGTRWRQAVLSCLPEDFVMNSTDIIEPTPVPKPDRDLISHKKTSGGYNTLIEEPEVLPTTRRSLIRPTTPLRDLPIPSRKSSGYAQFETTTKIVTTTTPFFRPPQRDIIRKPETSYSSFSREETLPILPVQPTYGSKKIIAKEEKLPIVTPIVKPTVVAPTYGSELTQEETVSGEEFLDEDQFGEEEEGSEEVEQPVAYGSSVPSGRSMSRVATPVEVAPLAPSRGRMAPVAEKMPVETRGRLIGGQRGRSIPENEDTMVQEQPPRGRTVPQSRARLALPDEPLPVETVQTRGGRLGSGQRVSGRTAFPVEEPVLMRPVGGRTGNQRNLGNF